jgi:hypothetical protein
MQLMKNEFTKTNLFSCPIYKTRIDPNSYDKEKILNDIKYNKSLKNTRNEPHQAIGHHSNIHHSYNDFENINFRTINYDTLMDANLKIFKEFFNNEISTTKEFGFTFNIVNYSAVTEGQYLPSHNHVPTADFATIHYLNFKDDHNPTCFRSPVSWAPHLHFILAEFRDTLDITEPDNSYFLKNFLFPVQEDDILIFPSAVDHQVMEQGPTDEPRVTISTNIKIDANLRGK